MLSHNKKAPAKDALKKVNYVAEVATIDDLLDSVGEPIAVTDSTATDVAGIVADHNTLLAALRTIGIIT